MFLKKYCGTVGAGFIWLKTGTGGGGGNMGKEPSGSIMDKEFLDWLAGWLTAYQLSTGCYTVRHELYNGLRNFFFF
jgi:hypothetical protein